MKIWNRAFGKISRTEGNAATFPSEEQNETA
jgi:hypothetical protein